MTLTIAPERPDSPDAALLLVESDGASAALHPPTSRHPIYADALSAPGAVFLLAGVDGQPIGCGAMLPMPESAAELKRMFVLPAARGQGIARALLSTLEHFPTEWSHPVGSNALENKAVEHYSRACWRGKCSRAIRPPGRLPPDAPGNRHRLGSGAAPLSRRRIPRLRRLRPLPARPAQRLPGKPP